MTQTVTFTVEGPPVVWKRARRNGKRYFTDQTQADYQTAVAWSAKAAGAKPVQGPLQARMTFYVPFPAKVGVKARASFEGSPAATCRLDIDNLAKNILDALNGVAYLDDKQVTELAVRKLWSAEPRAVISLGAVA